MFFIILHSIVWPASREMACPCPGRLCLCPANRSRPWLMNGRDPPRSAVGGMERSGRSARAEVTAAGACLTRKCTARGKTACSSPWRQGFGPARGKKIGYRPWQCKKAVARGETGCPGPRRWDKTHGKGTGDGRQGRAVCFSRGNSVFLSIMRMYAREYAGKRSENTD